MESNDHMRSMDAQTHKSTQSQSNIHNDEDTINVRGSAKPPTSMEKARQFISLPYSSMCLRIRVSTYNNIYIYIYITWPNDQNAFEP